MSKKSVKGSKVTRLHRKGKAPQTPPKERKISDFFIEAAQPARATIAVPGSDGAAIAAAETERNGTKAKARRSFEVDVITITSLTIPGPENAEGRLIGNVVTVGRSTEVDEEGVPTGLYFHLDGIEGWRYLGYESPETLALLNTKATARIDLPFLFATGIRRGGDLSWIQRAFNTGLAIAKGAAR